MIKNETIDFNKFTEEQVSNAFDILSEFIKDEDLRNVTNIEENNKSERIVLKKLYDYLTSKYNAEIITNKLKKC